MVWRLWKMSKQFGVPPASLIGVFDPLKAYFVNRGIWLFCSNLEAEMDERSDRAKNGKQSGAIRHQVLMEFLYPNNPEKRFRNPVVSSGQAGPAIGGEDFFSKDADKRRRT